MSSWSSTLVAVLLALTPGILRWYWGHALGRLVDDPILPERLLASQRRHQLVIFTVTVGMFLLAVDQIIGLILLLVVGYLAAGYPLRKRLYNETWSVPAYLGFFGRLIVSAYGFWILLLAAPFIQSQVGRADWMTGAALAGVLLAWNEHAADLLRWSLRAQPITDPGLVERFEQIVRAASDVGSPRFEFVDMRGGAVANALALPSLTRPGVLFTSTLLDLLDADETIAISAHEVAHLEYYNRRRLTAGRNFNIVLILMAISATPVSRLFLPSLEGWSWLPVLTVVMVTLVIRAKDRQKNETASDVRGAELCRDPDALARGLTKLYTFARLPRRFDAERERRATHPSLARRIRDIRGAAGQAPVPLTSQTIVSAATGPARVLFADDHLEWREMEGVTHSLSYPYLSELRVQARATGSTRLIAVEKSGRRWELPLKSDDVASVQAVLDMVDGRLAGTGPSAAATAVPRLVALLTAVVALSTGQAAAGLVALLATTYTQSRLLAASAAAAASAGILLILELSSGTGPLHWLAFFLVCLACVLVGLARTTRRSEPEALSDTPVRILAAVSGLIVLWLAVDGLDPIGLHQNIVMLPGAAVLVLALGAALIADTRRSLRRAASAALAIGALLVAARSARFLDMFGSDPFLVSASEIQVQTIAAEPQAEFDAPTRIAEIRLSPGARTMTMLDEEASDGDRNEPMTFYVGPPGGPFEQIRADDLALEENGRAVVLSVRDDGVDLREIDIAHPSVPLWQQHVPDITSSARLRLSGSREWQVLGLARRQRIVRAVGRVGDADAALTSWSVPSNSEYGWMDAVSAEGDGALYVESAFGSDPMSGSLLGRWYTALHAREESRLWHLSLASQLLAAHSRLSVHCTTGDPGSASLVCSAFDGERTRLAAVEPSTARITPIAAFQGRFRQYGSIGPGWISGWLNSTPVVVSPASNRALTVAARPREWIRALAATDSTIASVSTTGDGCIIRIYPIAQLDERSARR
jgi:Zn-dependent protease with chaperone function